MSLHDDQISECPLCMEPFEMDDINFFPCTCLYQICRFCWHRIRTDENGLCPACRKPYPEDPADFKPLTTEELQKIKNEKRQKDQQKKQKLSECRKHLANVRVVQKNLVFVVGLPARLADPETLKKHDYFGKFGKIHKVVVNQSTSYAGSQGPSASAYVTYCKPEDALKAIKSVNNIQVDGRTLKASLGTTKYCSHFLKNQQCPKTECMYLHELGDEAASFTKEDMQQGKHQEYEKKLQDQIIGNNNRKQEASPTPPQIITNSLKDSWPSPVAPDKKAKKNKSKTLLSDSSQHHSSSKTSLKDDSSPQKKSQKGKHKDTPTAQPSPLHSANRELSLGNLNEVIDSLIDAQEQKTLPKPVSASIKIARSESPVLPPSPLSSISSSFTPFGSFSSNFISSSSSPSPPPSNNNSTSFGSSNIPEDSLSVNTFIAPQQMEHKQHSPHSVFVDGNSFFSHNYNQLSSGDGTSYNGSNHSYNEDQSITDSSDWSSNFTFEEPQKPEDDLDFDPWNESSKGLADLIALEAGNNPNYSEGPRNVTFLHQTSKAPVPNQSRISAPPPGFCRQMPSSTTPPCTYMPINDESANKMFHNKSILQQARQNINAQSCHYQSDLPQNPFEAINQYKPQIPFNPSNIHDSLSDAVRYKKSLEERINLEMLQNYHTRNALKSQTQNGPMWNHHHQNRDSSYLINEYILNSGNFNEVGQRSNAIWMKALQQLSIDENQIHPSPSPYINANAFALRGQWATAQCPPPGFVAPSRSPVNTPFQHMQVNQKI
ncbi:CCR4-NOT transcription complex subunit 4 [Caerostris extrusa]|uniref:CCR4-NOT transcription complex subunit 4 n=1 Tax=Caerostris extrusa TaxID=172846 RepID=A0AAV4MXM4_CAEEX|nr:CCR4-NOT transcription complex subunit 4 [Caerostris extrusa]